MTKTHNLSIRATLLLVVGILTALISLLLGTGIYNAWVNESQARLMKQGSFVLNELYNAEECLSQERGASMAALYVTQETTTDNLADQINDSRACEKRNLTQALPFVLKKQNSYDLRAAIDVLAARLQDLNGYRGQLDDALDKPVDKRPPQLSDDAFKDVSATIDAVHMVITRYSRVLYPYNLTVTQQLRFKYFLSDLTEYTGREYAVVGRLVAENRPAGLLQREELIAWNGRLSYGWDIIDQYMNGIRLRATLGPYFHQAQVANAAATEKARVVFDGPQVGVQTIVPTLHSHGRRRRHIHYHYHYPITIAQWLALSRDALGSLHTLKDRSLVETQKYADKVERASERTIALEVAMFFAALALSLYSWSVILLRVIKPVNAMVDTLYKATSGESYEPLQISLREDEIGKLGSVLRIFQDTTDKMRQTSSELEERRNYLRAVLGTMSDGLVAIDQQGIIQLVNPAITRIFGFVEEELLGQNVTILMPEPTNLDPEIYLARFMAVRDAKYEGRDREATGRRKDGTLFPIEMMISEMRRPSGAVFVGILRDITSRKEAEGEREKYLRELESSNRELDDFAYITSHDLKEPLRGLHNFSRFLIEDYNDRLDDEGRDMLNTISRLTQQMEGLLNALLHYSRLGRTEMSIRSTDLNEIVKSALEMYAITIKQQDVEVKTERVLPVVVCDHVRIVEVFQNLIGNGIKYNQSAHKVIEIGWINGHARAPGQPVYYVRDNGIGIETRNIDTVFRIFHRLHPREAFGGGTGSGLSIVKKIITQHGGKIWAESEGKGKGTTFYFTIPPQTATAEAA